MNHVITPHSKLLGVIEPVLNDMPAGTLRHALFRAFWDETASLLDIEDALPGSPPGARRSSRCASSSPAGRRPTTRRPAFPDWPIA